MTAALLSLALIAWCSVFARMAGGGVWVNRPANVAEACMTSAIGLAVYLHYDLRWADGLAWAWSYLWFQTGHAVAFHMNNGVEHDAANGRKAFLSPVIDQLCRVLRQPLGGNFYCWSFMLLKGALIHAPLGYLCPAGAFMFAASYWLGHRVIKRPEVAEYLSGAFSGLLIAMSL